MSNEEDDAQEELFYYIGEQLTFDWDQSAEDDLNNHENNDDYAVPVEKSKYQVPTIREPVICKRCGDLNAYAEPNQKDGSYKCFSCRN